MVREITSEDEFYDDYYDQASVAANIEAVKNGVEAPSINNARLFDIEIRDEKGKIEPASPVQVNIRLMNMETEMLSVVHFAEVGLK